MTAYFITPVDTWFFRDARPFDVAGGSELSSVFPAPARSLASALVQARAPGYTPRTRDTTTGFIACRGPHLARRTRDHGLEPLYPVPLDLLRHPDGPWVRLEVRPEDAVVCDLGQPGSDGQPGKVLLPRLPQGQRGARPVEGWLTKGALERWLKGDPLEAAPVKAETLVKEEPRIGLARDNARRTAAEGMLFSTRHLRLTGEPAPCGLLMQMDWPDERGWPGGLLRLGGEGRLAEAELVRFDDGARLPLIEPPKAQGDERGLVLLLLTHGQFGNTSVPPGLKAEVRDGRTVFSGTLRFRSANKDEPGALDLTVEAAVVGKTVREGGWNPQKNRPRRVRSLIPAGSLWYCTLPTQNAATLAQAISALHGAHIGEDPQFGRGELAVGLWR